MELFNNTVFAVVLKTDPQTTDELGALGNHLLSTIDVIRYVSSLSQGTLMDPFYVTSHVRDEHMAAKKMDLPLHSTFVDSAPLVHTGNFGLESPSKQHSSLAESIDTVVSATTPTCNPINPLLESVPTVESVEQRSVLPQPIGEQPQDTQSPEGSPTLQPKRLHVSNIPFRYREHDLRTLFGVCSCV